MSKSDNSILKCIYCQNNLGYISIVCAKCRDFNLCLKCFSMSAEIGDHKKEHDYKIHAFNNYFPIFDNEKLWSYKEENYLLGYIEQFGFGNWDEISKNFEERSAQECMQHYFAYYIYGNIGKYSLNNNNDKRLQDKNNIDHTKDSDITVLLPPIEMSIEEQRALGYMPLRDDFEREYKNDAETLLSNLTINNDDDETDIQVKITLAKMYRETILDRQRLKKIARDYGLINNASALINKHRSESNGFKSDVENNKKRRREEDNSCDNLNEKYKKFAQLCNPSFYETLIENISKRNQLLSRIEELNKYHEIGIKTFKEIEIYKENKLKREQEKLDKINKKTNNRRSPISSPNKKYVKLLNENNNNNNNNSLSPSSTTYHSTNDIDDNHNNITNLSCDSNTSSNNSSNDNNSIITNVSNYSSSIGSLDHNNFININNRNGRSERICSMPGYNLLSENEKKLVASLKMKPTLYISFKTFLIKNNITGKRQLRTSTLLNEKKNVSMVDELDSNNSNNNSNSSNNSTSESSSILRRNNNKKLLLKRLNNNKLFNSFPNNNQIPRTTRKRIFNFLCDNGWIDI